MALKDFEVKFITVMKVFFYLFIFKNTKRKNNCMYMYIYNVIVTYSIECKMTSKLMQRDEFCNGSKTKVEMCAYGELLIFVLQIIRKVCSFGVYLTASL